MLIGKGRHIVDKHRGSDHGTLTAVRHILTALHLHQGTGSSFGIRSRKHQGITTVVNISVIERRVLAFPGILGQHTIVSFLEARTYIESTDSRRQIQAIIGTGHNDILISFLFEDSRRPYHPRNTFITHLATVLLQIHFQIGTADPSAMFPIPIPTLQTTENLKLYSLPRRHVQPRSTKRIVDTQTAFELVVKITDGHIKTEITYSL